MEFQVDLQISEHNLICIFICTYVLYINLSILYLKLASPVSSTLLRCLKTLGFVCRKVTCSKPRFQRMDSQESILQSVKDWTEATWQLLSTQSSLEQLSASDVDTIVNQLRYLLSTVGSLDAISTVCDAVDLLLEVNGDMVDNRDEVLEILQMMLNEFVEQAPGEDEVYTKEEVGERLSQVVERCGQGVFASQVLDGVAGHLLELVGKEEVAPSVRKSFLRAVLSLASSTEIEDRERLGEEYVADLDKLVDWLFSCGDYSTQTALVELLRR